MPEPWAPVYQAFKLEFEKYPVSQSTILIGHSCGWAFLVRWLGESKQSIDALVLGGKIISLSNRGHYVEDDMGSNEFPELLGEIH